MPDRRSVAGRPQPSRRDASGSGGGGEDGKFALVHETHVGEAEVRELEVAVGVDKDVVRLQVTVDDPLVVQILQCQHHLCHVLPRPLLAQASDALQESVAVSSLHVLHDQVEVLARLERADQLDHKRTVDRRHDRLLCLDVFELVLPPHVRLLQHLHRIQLTIQLVSA
eukprot:766409-Hanusia_phi.AAC.2